MHSGRVVVEEVRPVVDCGRLAAKAAVGLPLEVSATIITDGTDRILAWVRQGPPSRGRPSPATLPRRWAEARMALGDNDRWTGRFTPQQSGHWSFAIVAVPDDYGTWLRDLWLRFEAGQEVGLELDEGAAMAQRRAAQEGVMPADRRALLALARSLRSRGETGPRVAAAGAEGAVALMARTVDRCRATLTETFPLWVDRERAAFSSWYEFFPRSEGGTLAAAQARLPGIAAMGFDTVYLPPIHPIGRTHRKGRNNAVEARRDDPGSPWAIGGPEGGHTAVHPELGTIDDFDDFVRAATAQGLEVALDYALQCSPDHPWVREHPQWFRHRPDGSIRYAENPPKRYQDIYPINFDTDDHENLWTALRDILLFWIDHGVRIFRVDNPHTKTIAFWQWVISTVRERHPDTLFLAEAFTRPPVMRRLAKVGFTQSYTYFTWRNTAAELAEYLTELSQTSMVDYFRPNFWVNTPDILHEVLQHGGRPAFRMRAVLAALGAPSWGMYSGYELYESVALHPGSEEYLDSEKYQLRPRHWDDPGSLAPMIGVLNGIRRRHQEAVAQLRTLRVHHVNNPHMLCFSRRSDDRSDVLLVVVNLDPHAPQEGTTWLDLVELGLDATMPFTAHDELTDSTYVWHGPSNYVRLDPVVQPAHVLHLRAR